MTMDIQKIKMDSIYTELVDEFIDIVSKNKFDIERDISFFTRLKS